MAAGMAKGGALLFGRRTYQDFFSVWAGRKDNPFSPVLEKAQKYIASRTLKEPLPWKNSTLLPGEAVASVTELKHGKGKDIVVLGSGQLMKALMRADLIDTFVLLIHPLVLGEGKRLFADDKHDFPLKLVKNVPTPKGVVIATYERG
jgi:dihydrofolate reductase